MALAILAVAAVAQGAPGYGKISGVVVDLGGTPQMGATVLVSAEGPLATAPLQVLTNQHGVFVSERLLPGQYSLKVTLAGFLPGIERHIRVNPNLTTLVRVELDSMFASLDRLRRHSEAQPDPDQWKWVLRSSAATRPVLQWQDGQLVVSNADSSPAEDSNHPKQARARIELTDGALNPGSASHLPSSPGTAFAYDQSVGKNGRLLLAAQMSYDRYAAGGIAAIWAPSGEIGVGPTTTLVLRQAKVASNGLTFRGARLEHSDQVALGDTFRVQYSVEYVMVGLGRPASSLRPRIELDARISPEWEIFARAAAMPTVPEDPHTGSLETALTSLDSLPALMWRSGSPMLEGGWHEELGFQRRVGAHAYLEVSGFRDSLTNVAIYGRGPAGSPWGDYLRDYLSGAILYDGGSSDSWGTHVAYRQKLSEDLEISAVYAWAGALAVGDPTESATLRDALETRYRHSLAARVAARIPGAGTHIVASYKWVSGPTVSRQDPFGEAAYQLDPFLDISIRQPIPTFFMNGRWEALADFRNLLGEGYSAVNGRDGGILLVPSVRSFRGGLSFQF